MSKLYDLLNLEEIDSNLFRGQNFQAPWGRVFGGQVLAQALHAARRTVSEERVAHSLHGYFILPGSIASPIIYDVDVLRDGGSFTTRRVTARQKGRAIFIMATSFQKPTKGLEHQIEMPNVPPPEDLQTDVELLKPLKEKNEMIYNLMVHERPIEFRPVESFDPLNPEQAPPFRRVWLKAKDNTMDDLSFQQQVLAYASDYNLLTTALLPHRHQVKAGEYFLASLDHAMWFHRAVQLDDWLLYVLESPSASNLRGFTRGSIFNREGQLIASVAQEGVMAPYKK